MFFCIFVFNSLLWDKWRLMWFIVWKVKIRKGEILIILSLIVCIVFGMVYVLDIFNCIIELYGY